MQTATRKGPDGIAGTTSSTELPGVDALLSELGVVSPVVFAGVQDDRPLTDAGEAPSGTSIAQGDEERGAELDERIMAGLVRA